MKKYGLALLPLLLLPSAGLFSASPAFAQQRQRMGVIKRLGSSVSLEREGKTLPVAVGIVVFCGDRLRTGGDGRAGLTLSDDTLPTAGPGRRASSTRSATPTV